LIFDNYRRFSFILTRPDLPKFASNNRGTGTAEENKAIVQGSLAYFGTYSLVGKFIKMHVDGGLGQVGREPISSGSSSHFLTN